MFKHFGTICLWLACVSAGLLATTGARAAQPFLIVEGAVRGGAPAADGKLRKVYSEAELLAMPTASITTTTNWRPRAEFVGPTLASVLKAAGAEVGERTRIQLIALNEYSITVPASDLARYSPVLSHTVAGKRLARREFGPLWLMYPRDDFEELRNNSVSDGKLIWQVVRIVVH